MEEAAEWYEGQRPGLGSELLDEFDSCLAVAIETPEAGSPSGTTAKGNVIRRYRLRCFRRYALRMALIEGIAHGYRLRALEPPTSVLERSRRVASLQTGVYLRLGTHGKFSPGEVVTDVSAPTSRRCAANNRSTGSSLKLRMSSLSPAIDL